MTDMTAIKKAIDEFEEATEVLINGIWMDMASEHFDTNKSNQLAKRTHLLELIRKEVKDE